MIYLFIFILILGLSTPVEAKEADGGELVAPFKMGMGARATGMGRAFVALADDSSAIYWNPSGLGRLNGSEVNLSYFQPYNFNLIDRHSYYCTVSYGVPLSFPPGALGMGIAYLNIDDLPRYEESKEIGDFDSKQQIIFLSYGYRPNEVISIGATLKRVDYHLADYKDHSYGGDIGISFSPRERIRWAMLLQNLWEAKIRLIETEERFPFRVRSGLSYSWKELTYNINKMTFSLGVDYQFKDKLLDWGAGIEGEILEMMCLRCGYYEPAEEINLGAGIIISGWRLDYGFGLPAASELGPSHRLSLGRKFGQVE
ncbi:MAG: PorV/PorQ family protein [bacterium]|nr:PorV/PorQ family protein [bacterium]